jgi:hypothetical protein
LEVAISIDNDVVGIPSTVTVAANKKTATVKATHSVVSASTKATVSASLQGRTKSSSVTVKRPSVYTVSLSPGLVSSGGTSTGKVTLNAPAPEGGLLVTLKGNAQLVDLPSSVVVPEGSKTKTFSILAGVVPTKTTTKIYADSKYSVLTIKAVTGTSLVAFLVAPSPTWEGEETAGGVAIWDLAPSGGVKVTLKSNKPSVASVPSTVTIPRGEQIAVFEIVIGEVSEPTNVTLTASAGGSTLTLVLEVVPPGFSAAEDGGGQSAVNEVVDELEAVLND